MALAALVGAPTFAWLPDVDLDANKVTAVEASEPRTKSFEASFDEFSRIWRELETLRASDLAIRADELWETDPEPTLRAMILRIGREVPATLTSARRAERLEIRRLATEWTRARIDSGVEGRALWQNEVRNILADSSQVIQWCATARAIGRLGEYEFAPELAQRLAAKNPRLAHAVRMALHDLYLRWFQDPVDYEAFLPTAHHVCQDSLFMETARSRDREARKTLIELLAYEPQRAVALLSDPHPELRAAAAAAFGRAHNGETEGALETLLTHAETEIDGFAFQATLEALLVARGADPADSAEMVRLRGILRRRVDEGNADLQAPLADALRRLPWSDQEEGESSVLRGVELLVGQVTALSAPHRLTDRDVVVTSMFALQSLASRAGRAGLSVDRVLSPLNERVIGMIEDGSESDVVRVAAAKLLPLVGDVDSIARAATTLGARRTSPELRYNLLVALGAMASKLPATDPSAKLVLQTLLAQLDGDDANLRRRALGFLGSEELRALVQAAEPSALIASLGRESVADLQAQLLDLIALLGSSDHLDALIALPNFDAVASSGPGSISSLAQTLEALAEDDASTRVRGAARLQAVHHEASRILRLRSALGIVARMDDESLAGLTTEENHQIVEWAAELREAAGTLPGGEAFLGRLNRQHLPACLSAGEDTDARELAYVQALFLTDWIATNPEAGEPSQVLTHFQAALAYAVERSDFAARALVLRDRARFLVDQGRAEEALLDYRTLFESELPVVPAEPGSPARRTSVLELGDLRQGSALLAGSVDGGPDSAKTAREALRVTLVLVQESNWKLEPVAVRSQDMRDLVGRTLGVADVEALREVSQLLADLPDLPPLPVEGEPAVVLPPAPEGALWQGLLKSREEHAVLLDLRLSLSEALVALSPPDKAVDETAPKKASAPGAGENPGAAKGSPTGKDASGSRR